jgi:hypothetical protein
MDRFDKLVNCLILDNNNTNEEETLHINIAELESIAKTPEQVDKEDILNNVADENYMKNISNDVLRGTGIYKNKTGSEILHKGYKNLTDLENNPFLTAIWSAIQIIDVTQITSIPDVLSSQKDYIDDPTPVNAFWVAFHSFFLALGLVSLVSTAGGGVITDAMGISLKYSLKSHPEKVYELTRDYILPNKNKIVQALGKVRLNTDTIVSALNLLEKSILNK